MDLLRRLFTPADRRDASLDATIKALERRGFATFAGVPVNDQTAMQHLTVWACVSLIADSVAMMPLHTFAKAAGDELPERVADPPVIERPSSEMTRYEWHVRMLWSVLMRGNAYAQVLERGRAGIPTELAPLHPDEVRIERDKNDGTILYLVGRRNPETLTARDVLHVPGLVVPGSVYGLSPIDYARQTIGTGLAATEYGARFFAEGATPTGVLSTDQKLDLDTAAEYQARWEEAHGHRQRKVAVLGGGLSYSAVQLSPEASQFLSTMELSRAQIAGFYRVPPHLVGDVDRSTSWGTGIEEQGHQYVTFTCGPWLRRFEDAWRDVLGPGSSLYARYNTAALLRSRLTERFAAYTAARQGGWMNVDEIRALEELGPLPDDMGQDYLQPLNFAPVQPGGGTAEPAAVTPPAT